MTIYASLILSSSFCRCKFVPTSFYRWRSLQIVDLTVILLMLKIFAVMIFPSSVFRRRSLQIVDLITILLMSMIFAVMVSPLFFCRWRSLQIVDLTIIFCRWRYLQVIDLIIILWSMEIFVSCWTNYRSCVDGDLCKLWYNYHTFSDGDCCSWININVRVDIDMVSYPNNLVFLSHYTFHIFKDKI